MEAVRRPFQLDRMERRCKSTFASDLGFNRLRLETLRDDGRLLVLSRAVDFNEEHLHKNSKFDTAVSSINDALRGTDGSLANASLKISKTIEVLMDLRNLS